MLSKHLLFTGGAAGGWFLVNLPPPHLSQVPKVDSHSSRQKPLPEKSLYLLWFLMVELFLLLHARAFDLCSSLVSNKLQIRIFISITQMKITTFLETSDAVSCLELQSAKSVCLHVLNSWLKKTATLSQLQYFRRFHSCIITPIWTLNVCRQETRVALHFLPPCPLCPCFCYSRWRSCFVLVWEWLGGIHSHGEDGSSVCSKRVQTCIIIVEHWTKTSCEFFLPFIVNSYSLSE